MLTAEYTIERKQILFLPSYGTYRLMEDKYNIQININILKKIVIHNTKGKSKISGQITTVWGKGISSDSVLREACSWW